MMIILNFDMCINYLPWRSVKMIYGISCQVTPHNEYSYIKEFSISQALVNPSVSIFEQDGWEL